MPSRKRRSNDEYYTKQEAQSVLRENWDAHRPGLLKDAEIEFQKKPPGGQSAADVVQQVYTKVDEGDRRLPRNVLVSTSLHQILRSLISNGRQRPGAAQLTTETSFVPSDQVIEDEERAALLEKCKGRKLAERIVSYITDCADKGFDAAVRARAIASALEVTREEVYNELKWLKRIFSHLR